LTNAHSRTPSDFYTISSTFSNRGKTDSKKKHTATELPYLNMPKFYGSPTNN